MKKSTGIIIVALIESATLIINTCITSKISYNEGYKQAQADAQNETSILSQSVNEVDSQAQFSFESEIGQLQQNEYSENSSVKQNNVYKENSIDDNSSENISNVDNSDTDTTTPSLIGVSWSDEDRYELFSGNGNNGFIMFGKTYTNGFTISMGASYNIWGNGTQYVTYNIESISKMYSSIKKKVRTTSSMERISISDNADGSTSRACTSLFLISDLGAIRSPSYFLILESAVEAEKPIFIPSSFCVMS